LSQHSGEQEKVRCGPRRDGELLDSHELIASLLHLRAKAKSVVAVHLTGDDDFAAPKERLHSLRGNLVFAEGARNF